MKNTLHPINRPLVSHTWSITHLAWINYKISLTWIVRLLWDDFPPKKNSILEWGRDARSSWFAQIINLVGGLTPLKNMKVSWDHCSQYTEQQMFQTTNQ